MPKPAKPVKRMTMANIDRGDPRFSKYCRKARFARPRSFCGSGVTPSRIPQEWLDAQAEALSLFGNP